MSVISLTEIEHLLPCPPRKSDVIQFLRQRKRVDAQIETLEEENREAMKLVRSLAKKTFKGDIKALIADKQVQIVIRPHRISFLEPLERKIASLPKRMESFVSKNKTLLTGIGIGSAFGFGLFLSLLVFILVAK